MTCWLASSRIPLGIWIVRTNVVVSNDTPSVPSMRSADSVLTSADHSWDGLRGVALVFGEKARLGGVRLVPVAGDLDRDF